jgi:hypothetical protein
VRYLIILTMLVLFGACGDQSSSGPTADSSAINEINARINALSVTANALDAIIQSDFSTCPASGDTADALIRKICQVAQASTIELQVQLQNEMGAFVSQLKSQIDANKTDLASQQTLIDAANTAIAANSANITSLQGQITAANAAITVINANVSNLQVDVASLQSRMTSVEAAILALQNLTASINGTLAGTMVSVSVGEENISAGPVYEAILKRVDKTRFNGYVEAYGSYQSLGANPVTAVNASATVTIASTAHGYLVGDIVELNGFVSGRGFLTGDVLGQYTIVTVPNANSFTLTMPRLASSGGTFGGSVATVRKVNGRGMATLWKSGNVSDAAVRVTSAASKQYNFVIRRRASDATNNTAELCYDTSNRSATFATINAVPEGGSGNIVCK